jgi:hypothetical protein
MPSMNGQLYRCVNFKKWNINENIRPKKVASLMWSLNVVLSFRTNIVVQ